MIGPWSKYRDHLLGGEGQFLRGEGGVGAQHRGIINIIMASFLDLLGSDMSPLFTFQKKIQPRGAIRNTKKSTLLRPLSVVLVS